MMDWPLYWRLPPRESVTSETLLDKFLDYVTYRDLTLYPAQEEALLALFDGQNVILNTPTGSGKSLVASGLHFAALAQGRRSFYTCPIKALVNEKFRDLSEQFGPDHVGLITGDGSVNAQAPIICCTAEILANLAAREGADADVGDVVMDEFHYYSDKQRGVAWQIPLLILKRARFLLMSATLGEVDFFARSLTQLNGLVTEVVRGTDRPVPLDFSYRETPLFETVADLVALERSPIYLVNFSQREAAEEAQNLLSVNFASKAEKARIAEHLVAVDFRSPYGRDVERYLRHGIGLHHAGLLPKYRALVERLAQAGLLKVVSGTDTLGVGVNVPIRTVLFSKLCKYDGEKTAILSAREFHQISGRAGRKGFDTLGFVVAQAPAHVIENIKLKAKAAGDAKKARKIVLRNPPPRGFVMWTKETFNKLIAAQPEPLVSRFQIGHGLLLNVLGRANGVRALRELIRDSHGPSAGKRAIRQHAKQLFRALLERRIVEVIPGTRQLRVNVSLQDDFSLNHSLALYLVDTVELIDPATPTFALDVLTVAESILESPELILRRQLDRVKDIKMAEMKAAGIEYEERMEELEKCEAPKPNREFIYSTFNTFSAAHPWVGQENIRPKSIAREMYEGFYSFAEYVREYELQRVEGLLLRYLSDVYKVLEQTIPPRAQTDAVMEIAHYFGQMVREVDSSLIEEWEAKRRGDTNPAKPSVNVSSATAAHAAFDVKRFRLEARRVAQNFVKELAKKDFSAALAAVQSGTLTPVDLENSLSTYLEDHVGPEFGPSARHPQWTEIEATVGGQIIRQRLVDRDGHNDWVAEFFVAEPALAMEPLAIEFRELREISSIREDT